MPLPRIRAAYPICRTHYSGRRKLFVGWYVSLDQAETALLWVDPR